MKIFFISVWLLLQGCGTTSVSTNQTAQSTQNTQKAQLLHHLDTYFEVSNRLDTTKIIDMIYYKVFDVVPKDT